MSTQEELGMAHGRQGPSRSRTTTAKAAKAPRAMNVRPAVSSRPRSLWIPCSAPAQISLAFTASFDARQRAKAIRLALTSAE